MRHSKKKLQFNRFTSWRKATLISLAKAVIIHQKIKTTKTKAKAVRPLIEKLISMGKENSLSSKRRAYEVLGDHKMVSMLFKDISVRFAGKTGGYTRILNYGVRQGDNAPLVVLALTEIREKLPRKPKIETTKKEPQKSEALKEEIVKEELPQEKISKAEVAVKEKPPITKKPTKKFLGGLRGIFKKERDSL